MGIRYLYNYEINVNAWDSCIAHSINSSMQAFSWYLDLVCENWDALVEDDYLSVMPLPVYRFFGRDIILHPSFVNELGIFSKAPINAAKTADFISAIPTRFAYYRTLLNKYNPTAEKNAISHVRFEIDLIKPYPKLYAGYSHAMQQQLHQAAVAGAGFATGLSSNDLLHFIKEKKIALPRLMRKNNFRQIRTLIAGLIRYKSGDTFGVYDNHNELCSAAIIGWTSQQIQLLFHIISPDAMKQYAHYWLIDQVIKKFAETYATLVLYNDSPAHCYVPLKEYGAFEIINREMQRNNLPFPLNRLIHQEIFTTFISSSQLVKS
jgi:hypothetical protein